MITVMMCDGTEWTNEEDYIYIDIGAPYVRIMDNQTGDVRYIPWHKIDFVYNSAEKF
jgi:hypothetical protein